MTTATTPAATPIPASNIGTMSTQDFLAALRARADRPLVFDHGAGRVHPGYHVTEVKAATFETMDCGGQGNLWFETIVQLKSYPDREERGFMRVDKFLSIYERAASAVPVRAKAEIKFEYGDEGAPAINYHVDGLADDGEALVVRLTPPNVTCKASDRQRDAQASSAPPSEPAGASACCAPSVQGVELEMVASAPKKAGGCC